MTALNAAMTRLQPLPPRIARLPVDERGYPIPFFAQREPTVDFRIVRPAALSACLKERRCWVCGEPRGRNYAFVLGPMCAVTRTNSEPPCHRDCAVWSAVACPFLTRPNMRRNERDMPEGAWTPGIAIRRNPGVVAVWVTRSFQPFRARGDVPGATPGLLFEVGDPTDILWFAEGRAATRAEVLASLQSGLPALESVARIDPRPAAARADLEARAAFIMARLPPGEAA
jgi:hypothetical protein